MWLQAILSAAYGGAAETEPLRASTASLIIIIVAVFFRGSIMQRSEQFVCSSVITYASTSQSSPTSPQWLQDRWSFRAETVG